MTDTLRTALTKAIDRADPPGGMRAGTPSISVAVLRTLLAAHPAEVVSDARREDVAREAEIEREALRQFPDDPYMDDRDQVRLGFEAGAGWAFTRLAVLPAPPVMDEAEVRERIAQDIARAVGEGTASDIARGTTR